MTEAQNGISVGRSNGNVRVCVAGRGTFRNGQPLRRYALEMIGNGARQFVVDLGLCDGMDSTFLGVLAGIGLQLREPATSGKVRLANVNPRNLELLQTVGLDRLFDLAPASEPVTASLQMQRLPDLDASQIPKVLVKKETADLMLEAHTNLIRADNRNLSKFKDVTSVLSARAELNHGKPQ